MKIKLIRPYISIIEFSPIEINDFTILTGKNGSGKTHFLNAIKEGYIEIEGIDKSEIVYYNYNDFTIFTGNLQNNPQFQNKLNLWNNEKKQNLQKIQTFKTKVNTQFENLKSDPLQKFFYKYLKLPNFNFELYFSNKKDFELLNELKNSNINSTKLVENQRKFTPLFFNFVRQYLKIENPSIDLLNYEFLKKNFTDLQDLLEQLLKEEDYDLYKFLKSKVQGKNIFNLDISDFESPNLFLEDIAEEEKEYQLKKTQNILNKIKSQEYNENTKYLEREDFFQLNGLSPVELINNVLAEYDCNGYFLSTNKNQQFLGVDKKDIKFQISLQHKEMGYTTAFDQLSSGEKTLIALSLFIYKTRKNKIISRVLLLDEVDSSLHPSMINRLLNVLENLFIKEQDFKVILATHSPTTVALSPAESIYIIEKNSKQKIKKEAKTNAINILTEGIATLNEEETNVGINYNIAMTELPILFTEGITDKIILEIAWHKLYDTKMPFFIQDCFDASFLGNLFRRAEDCQDGIFTNYPLKKFIALFDFDQGGYNVWDSFKNNYILIEENPRKALTLKHNSKNAYALLLPVPCNDEIIKQVILKENETFKNSAKLQIELMFYGIESMKKYYIKEQISGGGEIIVFKGKKRDFANNLGSLNKSDFENFIPLFKKIEELLE